MRWRPESGAASQSIRLIAIETGSRFAWCSTPAAGVRSEGLLRSRIAGVLGVDIRHP